MLATMSEVGITWRWYVSQVTDTVGIVSLMHGLYKSIFFGFFIAIIGCYMGLKIKGGTEGVGAQPPIPWWRSASPSWWPTSF